MTGFYMITVSVMKELMKQLCSSIFSASFKLTNITLVFKVGSRNRKHDYRPIRILPINANIFEKLTLQQLSGHFDNIFSKFRCGFRKGFGTHHCLLLIVEKREKAVGNKKVFGAFLTDLSKAINCVSHDLLIAKLHAYRLSFTALRLLMQDYLKKSQTAYKKLNLRLPTATGKIQWTQQVKSTSTWCRHYVDTSKVKHRRIYTSFRRTFSM